MSLTDLQIIAAVDASLEILKPIALQLTAYPESSPKYTKYHMIETINVLQRKTAADPQRIIKPWTIPQTSVTQSDLTAAQIQTAVEGVLALLGPCVTRLNIQAMASELFDYDQIKKACDILTYKKDYEFSYARIIKPKTGKFQLNRNFVYASSTSRVIV